MQLISQGAQRLPLDTGPSGSQTFFHSDSTIWMVDGSMVFYNTSSVKDTWVAMPQLYHCGMARVARATNSSVSVVAQRQVLGDSSWWTFSSTDFSRGWTDSLRLEAVGFFVGSTAKALLFSNTTGEVAMEVSVWRYDGSYSTLIPMPTVRLTRYTYGKQCGDSVIVVDRGTFPPRYDVLRGVSKDPSSWTTETLSELIFGIIGEGDAFVYRTANGTFIDHKGEVRTIAVFDDRLLSLYVDGLRAATVGSGGIEIAEDITNNDVTRVNVGTTLVANSDNVITLRRAIAGLQHGDGSISLAIRVTDPAPPHNKLVSWMKGTRSRGTRLLLSGESVTIGECLLTNNGSVSSPSVVSLTEGSAGVGLVEGVSTVTPQNQTMLRRIGNEIWVGTQSGVYSVPTGKLISNRPAYDATGNDERAYILTGRGVEVRYAGDTTFRLFVAEPGVAAMAIAGDSLVLIRVEDISEDQPEARWVVDSYDLLGNPRFYGALLADSVISKKFILRSLTMTNAGLILNGDGVLFQSTDGGVFWQRVQTGVRIPTALNSYNGTVCAWVVGEDGRQGPALMITPSRWVFQPTQLRTPVPVMACANMPGWFVITTSDGRWAVRQTISSVWESPLQENETHLFSEPDEVRIYDLTGNLVENLSNQPAGCYVIVMRKGDAYRTSLKIYSR